MALRVAQVRLLELRRVALVLGLELRVLEPQVGVGHARLGGTENYVVTREFRRISSPVQRAQLLECLFAVAASDGEISVSETSTPTTSTPRSANA